MKDDFDYQAVPYDYIHCFNQDCPRSESCLRHLAAMHAPKTTPYIATVNPAAYPEDYDHCPHFRSAAKVRFAWGIESICDNIPYKTALTLKACLHNLYPKTTYYRILHQERPLSPEEQAVIARIFVQNGVTTPPVFDRYTDDYDFKNK